APPAPSSFSLSHTTPLGSQRGHTLCHSSASTDRSRPLQWCSVPMSLCSHPPSRTQHNQTDAGGH
uniref:Uncharacterized protein n=2 Tax=Emiliania huxleyi TaxID=2903 RepID=A0A0D3I826_EMIH1